MSGRPAAIPMLRRSARGAGAVLMTGAGLLAAFAVASCCALPFLLATAGLGAAGLGGVAQLAAPYRGPLLAVAAVSLAAGAFLQWRVWRVAACAPDAPCVRPAVRHATTVALLLGVVLLYLGYSYV